MFKKAKALFEAVKTKLTKTSNELRSSITSVFKQKVEVDDKILEDLEESLILADVSFNSSQEIIQNFKTNLSKLETDEVVDSEFYLKSLQKEIYEILDRDDISIALNDEGVSVIIVSGVNGSGKTTTIGKLAYLLGKENKVMVVAADTFRAAAIEQLEVWSKKADVDFFSNESKDPASVAYASIELAKKSNIDIVIIDTAGRLGNNDNLMSELAKIEKIVEKQENVKIIENLLVLDGTSGQNALSQVEKFKATVSITGLVITKLDSTSKAGFAISASYDYNLPIKLIGVGETLDDLIPFDSEDFSKALLGLD